MKEAALYQSLPDGRVRCTACARYCTMRDGQTGLCGIRQNVQGKLQLLVYGRIIAGHVDPIEKKPLVHFYPGSSIFSVATTGCNWLCKYCQNFDISQRRKVEGEEMSPEQVVSLALKYGSEGIAYTYNEPTVFIEYARDIGLAAHAKGLFNIFVSNGFGTPEAVGTVSSFLDAMTVDFKGNAERNFVRRYIGVESPDAIFQYLLELRDRTKVHLEFTDLIVPGVGDSLEEAARLSRWLYDNFGPDAPIHFLRFHPDYRMNDFPHTPVEVLEAHCRVAKEAGLRFVYIGNVPGHPLEHTYCPECGSVAIQRYGFDIVSWNLDKDNRCRQCGCRLPVVGRLGSRWRYSRFLPVIN